MIILGCFYCRVICATDSEWFTQLSRDDFFSKAYQIHRLRSSNAETPDPMPDAHPVIDFGLKDVKTCDGIAKQTITSQSSQNKT